MSKSQRPRPNRSVTRGVGPRDTRPFSSFDDLAEWAVRLGRASDVADVREKRRDIWGDLLFEWYSQGQVACVFASTLARDPDAAKWYSLVVDGPWTASDLTALVDAGVGLAAEAVQLILPGNGSIEQALDLIRRLAQHDRWECVDNGWLDGEEGDSVHVGLRWFSPRREYESWVLGIAPFEPMPFTRRFVGAPFIALVLRPTPPMPERVPENRRSYGRSGTEAAHLAHMDDGLGPDNEKRKKWREGTAKAKRALISPDPLSRARARVTFAFPPWVRQELGSILLSASSDGQTDSASSM